MIFKTKYFVIKDPKNFPNLLMLWNLFSLLLKSTAFLGNVRTLMNPFRIKGITLNYWENP